MPIRNALFTLALLPGLAHAHGTPPDTNWTTSSLSVRQLATLVDKTLDNLNSISMDYQYVFQVDVGRGNFLGMGMIKDATHYRVKYPVVGFTEESGLTTESVVQSGRNAMVFTELKQGGYDRKPAFAPLAYSVGPNILDNWYRNNVKLVLTAIGRGGKPLESLVSAAASNPEFTVKAESRYRLFRNEKIKDYRIVVSRKPEAAKQKGVLFYEILIGDKYFFPLSMNNTQKHGKRVYTTHMTNTRWNNNPHQKYSPDDFNLRKPEADDELLK